MPLKTQGNSILVPTEEGLVSVPIEEFDVVMVDEQIMLLAEENPAWVVLVGLGIFKITQGAKTGILLYAGCKYGEGRFGFIKQTYDYYTK